jgi:hypothetical protein
MNQNLYNAVVEQFGGEEEFEQCFQDVCNHGIAGGFSGFIYYSETNKFYEDNRELIFEWIDEMVDEGIVSTSALEKAHGRKVVYNTLSGKEIDTYLANHLAWMVAEAACHERANRC